MTKEDIRKAKKSILKCLTEDFDYGRKKDGTPLKRRKLNQAIFNAKDGHAIFNGTDLEMIMDKVILGLYFALADNDPA